MPTSGEAHLRRLVTDASTSGDWDRAWETVVPQIESGTTSKSSVGPSRISTGVMGASFIRPVMIGSSVNSSSVKFPSVNSSDIGRFDGRHRQKDGQRDTSGSVQSQFRARRTLLGTREA